MTSLFKSSLIPLVVLTLTTFTLKAQEVTKVFIKNGNIHIQYDDANSRKITSKGIDSQPRLIKSKNCIIFLRIIKNTNKNLSDANYIMMYDLTKSSEKILVAGCTSDGKDTEIAYGSSDQYPGVTLCDISNIQISPDNERIYFETSAWEVSNAVHFYNIPNGKIAFCHSGTLNKILLNGNLEITITGVDRGKGRFYQNWLFDKNGNPIKSIGTKEY